MAEPTCGPPTEHRPVRSHIRNPNSILSDTRPCGSHTRCPCKNNLRSRNASNRQCRAWASTTSRRTRNRSPLAIHHRRKCDLVPQCDTRRQWARPASASRVRQRLHRDWSLHTRRGDHWRRRESRSELCRFAVDPSWGDRSRSARCTSSQLDERATSCQDEPPHTRVIAPPCEGEKLEARRRVPEPSNIPPGVASVNTKINLADHVNVAPSSLAVQFIRIHSELIQNRH